MMLECFVTLLLTVVIYDGLGVGVATARCASFSNREVPFARHARSFPVQCQLTAPKLTHDERNGDF